MKKSLLVFVVFVLLISGCPGIGDIGGPAAEDGMIIKDFSFDYSPIYAGEEIGLTMEVQNMGGEKGVLNNVTLYGVDVAQSCNGQGALQWCTDQSTTQSPLEPLYPPDPTTGFEGDTWYYSWLFQAPTYIRTETGYTFDARIEYGYSTTYVGTLRIIDNNYLRTLPKDEREQLIQQGGIIESSTTGGPLSLAAASGRHFIVRSTTSDSRPIKFKVTNVGSGFPYDGDISDSSKLHQVRVSIAMPSDFITCSDPTLKLSRGEAGVLSCDIDVPGIGTTWTNKLDKKFSITLQYEYYVDGKTSITVNPTYEEIGCAGSPSADCGSLSGDNDGDGDIDITDIANCAKALGCNWNNADDTCYDNCGMYDNQDDCTTAGCTWL